jgi:hypothetical protein
VHGTSCHSVFGYVAVKHPFWGVGVRDMVARQASRFADSVADGWVAVGAGADSLEAGISGSAGVARLDQSADKKLAMTIMPRTFPTGPRVEPENFMESPFTNAKPERVSSRSRRSRANSVFCPATERLLWRMAFRAFASRLRALASLLLSLERRRIAHPKA